MQWRLVPNAQNDFDEPYSGFLNFDENEVSKTITLTTRADQVLEGEERFLLSLVSADNNANINPLRAEATVVILPNPGAAGKVSIASVGEIVIGEPDENTKGVK